MLREQRQEPFLIQQTKPDEHLAQIPRILLLGGQGVLKLGRCDEAALYEKLPEKDFRKGHEAGISWR